MLTARKMTFTMTTKTKAVRGRTGQQGEIQHLPPFDAWWESCLVFQQRGE